MGTKQPFLIHRSRAAAFLALLSLGLAACQGKSQPAAGTPAPQATSAASATAAASPAAAATSAAPPNLISLKTSPERGPGGTKFTVTGESLPPSAKLEMFWGSHAGSYNTEFKDNSIEFVERTFKPVRKPLGQANTDAQGKFTASFTAPEDFGNVHDIYATIDGKDVAKAGFFIEKAVSVSPREGPVGTPITVTVTGMGWKTFESTAAVKYDNRYMGFVSATTTNGSAKFTFRATGPVGNHYIEFYCASAATPYLNCEQSPVSFLGTQRAAFRVTADNGAPPTSFEWSDPARIAKDPPFRTTVGTVTDASLKPATVTPSSGEIKSPAVVAAQGLKAGAAVELVILNVAGNRVRGGWDLGPLPLGKGTVGADGTLTANVTIPEMLGGWHAVQVLEGGKPVAEASYFVLRSVVQAPKTVKAGETFTIQLKGVGWTELDNGFAANYDNGYIGYACGFSTNGDVTMTMQATGAPGTHLIDLYPMIYDNGHGKFPWQYTLPHLTYAQDGPGLALGYNLPVIRLAIEVTG